jgi:hypothetical protein
LAQPLPRPAERVLFFSPVAAPSIKSLYLTGYGCKEYEISDDVWGVLRGQSTTVSEVPDYAGSVGYNGVLITKGTKLATGGACQGDSGGPAFLRKDEKLQHESPRAVAAVMLDCETKKKNQCDGTTYLAPTYTRVFKANADEWRRWLISTRQISALTDVPICGEGGEPQGVCHD